jgi:hypothetical protein
VHQYRTGHSHRLKRDLQDVEGGMESDLTGGKHDRLMIIMTVRRHTAANPPKAFSFVLFDYLPQFWLDEFCVFR